MEVLQRLQWPPSSMGSFLSLDCTCALDKPGMTSVHCSKRIEKYSSLTAACVTEVFHWMEWGRAFNGYELPMIDFAPHTPTWLNCIVTLHTILDIQSQWKTWLPLWSYPQELLHSCFIHKISRIPEAWGYSITTFTRTVTKVVKQSSNSGPITSGLSSGCPSFLSLRLSTRGDSSIVWRRWWGDHESTNGWEGMEQYQLRQLVIHSYDDCKSLLNNLFESELVYHGSSQDFDRVMPRANVRKDRNGNVKWKGTAIFATADPRVALYYTGHRLKSITSGINLIDFASPSEPIRLFVEGGHNAEDALDQLYGNVENPQSCTGYIYLLDKSQFVTETGLGKMELITREEGANIGRIVVNRRRLLDHFIQCGLLQFHWSGSTTTRKDRSENAR